MWGIFARHHLYAPIEIRECVSDWRWCRWFNHENYYRNQDEEQQSDARIGETSTFNNNTNKTNSGCIAITNRPSTIEWTMTEDHNEWGPSLCRAVLLCVPLQPAIWFCLSMVVWFRNHKQHREVPTGSPFIYYYGIVRVYYTHQPMSIINIISN